MYFTVQKNKAVVIVVPRFSFSKVVVANRSYPFTFSVRISSYICYIGNTAVLVFRIAQLELTSLLTPHFTPRA